MWKGQRTGTCFCAAYMYHNPRLPGCARSAWKSVSYPAPATAVLPLQPLTKEIGISWPSERRCYSVNKRCIHQHRDCHTLRSTNQQLSFIFLEGAPPPPSPGRHEQELLLFGQRQRGGCASLRRADAAQVCSNLGLVDGEFECSFATAARQIVSERW